MLLKQFLLAPQDSHPNNINHINFNPVRLIKNTLSQHDNYIRPLIRPRNPQHYKFLLKPFILNPVSAYIQSQDNNTVLDELPQPKDKSGSNLLRRTRFLLSQLKYGYSSILNSYLSRIREDVTDDCPDCQMHPHTTRHLFYCPSNPTPLTAPDLLHNPTNW